MNIINGKKIALEIKKELAEKISKLHKRPNLAVILVGKDPASQLYVKLKEKACKETGIESHTYYLDDNASKKEIIEVVKFLNNDNEIHGILIQFPLPHREWENEIISNLDPGKDVDGFHKENIKKLLANKPYIIPGLAQGIMILIKSAQENLEHKKCAIVSSNEIFYKPLKFLLEKESIDVNIINPENVKLKIILPKADIIISAVGKKHFIKKSMIKNSAIVIDVGITKIRQKVYGDVDFKKVKEIKEGWITPVPGGVGPMTVAMLLKNTYELFTKYK